MQPSGRATGTQEPAQPAQAGQPPAELTPAPVETPGNKPAPAEKKPAPTENKRAPAENEPVPAEKKPAPAENKPAPAENKPAPAEHQPAPAAKKPAPAEGKPAPADNKPAPAQKKPAPAEKKPPPAQKTPPPAKAQPAQQAAAPAPIPKPASAARPKRRHGFILALFLVIVVAPVGVAAWYLYTRAVDQYASTVGFSVRSEEGPNATDLLGGMIGNLSSGSSSDTDVISAFIESQDLVERVDARLDLRAIYTKPEGDPYFALEDDASIEDLVSYWNRMVTVYYDSGQGLIELRVLAFEAQDAQDIARAVFDESAALINELTAIARADATRYARQDLEEAVERLKEARAELTAFRSREQIVDPTADIQGQMGLLNTLQAQLAEAMIDLDLLRETTREGDPRIRQTEQRIAVIEKRIREERAKFGIGGAGEDREAYATLVGEFESLMVDREFAEQSYLSALTALEAAQAEAERQTRYLAAHIRPTLAQSAEYPQRETILMVLALFAFAAWATAALIFYSVKDRR